MSGVEDDARERAWAAVHDTIARMPGWAVGGPASYHDDALWHVTAVDLRPRGRQAKRDVVEATGATEIAALGTLVELLGDRASKWSCPLGCPARVEDDHVGGRCRPMGGGCLAGCHAPCLRTGPNAPGGGIGRAPGVRGCRSPRCRVRKRPGGGAASTRPRSSRRRSRRARGPTCPWPAGDAESGWHLVPRTGRHVLAVVRSSGLQGWPRPRVGERPRMLAACTGDQPDLWNSGSAEVAIPGDPARRYGTRARRLRAVRLSPDARPPPTVAAGGRL
jgi:hypothetical protein